MICADTSSVIAYLQGAEGSDVELVDRALADQSLVLAPVSITELLSDQAAKAAYQNFVLAISRLDVKPGYWERAGELRALLIRHRYKPKIADTLIAQSCLDHQVPLITRDQDFRAFQKYAGLRLP